MTHNVIWWRVYVFRLEENRTLLNRLVRELHPQAPEVWAKHVTALGSRKRKAVVPGDDGSELVLTRGETKTIDGSMHYQITVEFAAGTEVRKVADSLPAAPDPGDYGLAEFDRISSSLAHSAPVAEAIRAIQREEVKYPDWR